MSRLRTLIQHLYRSYLCGPSHPCKLRIARWIERRLFPDQGLPFQVEDGIHLYLHPRYEVEYKLLHRRQYQASLCRFMRQNLSSGDIVAIAGVSFGHQTIIASKAVGTSGSVIAIDPSPGALIRTHSNLLLNSVGGNVKLVSAALGDQPAAVPMRPTLENDVQGGSLIKQAGSVPFTVLVENLPSLFLRLGVLRVDTLILDVIGFEIPVLRGLRAPLLPKLMTLCIHPWVLQNTRTTLADHKTLLESLDYGCWTLDGTPAESAQTLRGSQLVAVHKNAPVPRWLEKDPTVPLGVFDA
jgi:FkbM family methyltransferase